MTGVANAIPSCTVASSSVWKTRHALPLQALLATPRFVFVFMPRDALFAHSSIVGCTPLRLRKKQLALVLQAVDTSSRRIIPYPNGIPVRSVTAPAFQQEVSSSPQSFLEVCKREWPREPGSAAAAPALKLSYYSWEILLFTIYTH